MLFVGIILFGMLIGALAQLILARRAAHINWPEAFVAGLVGSFAGGLVASLLAGDGVRLRPSGIVGSLVGAFVVTAGWAMVARAGGRATGPPRAIDPS